MWNHVPNSWLWESPLAGPGASNASILREEEEVKWRLVRAEVAVGGETGWRL